MTDLSKFKALKGTPPTPGDAPDVIAADLRVVPQETRPLQFRLPVGVVREFNRIAAVEGDYSHGAKKALFLRMWDAYKSR